MRAVVIEVLTEKFEKTKIQELKELARSAGYDVVKEIVQKRWRPDPAYLIGKGKLKELKGFVEKESINTIIFSNNLKANQAFRIRKELGWNIDVIDRNILILKIFEERSRTAEAKMQIELARLHYMLPWVREYLRFRNLYGEQVGWGALGEYLHKVYEQHITKRIKLLERKLEKVRMRNFERIVKRRAYGLPEVVLTGYTQAGKTELFNKLTCETKPVGLGPFTTLSTYSRRLSMINNHHNEIVIVDSIGFIEDMHPIILNAFYTTLKELALSDLIVLVVDGAEEIDEIKMKINVSREIISKIAPSVELIIALNKIDLIKYEDIEKVVKVVKEIFPYTDVIPISAKKSINLNTLVEKIIEKINTI
jgi:GTP-binding protein HflX